MAFTFLRDGSDNTLMRWDEAYVSSVYVPTTKSWKPWQINPFTASVTKLTVTQARQMAPGGDLFAASDD